jgi:hypothetical protein
MKMLILNKLYGKVTVHEFLYTLIFCAVVIHIIALIFGIPIDVEVFDAAR